MKNLTTVQEVLVSLIGVGIGYAIAAYIHDNWRW
jgi:hypothetical protein